MRYGIDLGGTKTELIALDANDREVFRKRVATPSKNYEQIIETIASLVKDADAATRSSHQASIGIGIPGAISPATGLIKNANTTCLIGKAFDRDLEAQLGRPVRLANDANCFALSEASDGAGAGAAVVFGVILGTGVGGGIVVDGKILNGPNSIAGEWGHNPLPWPSDEERPGPACYCDKSGCIETFLSGPGFALDHERATGEKCSATEIQNEASLLRYEDRLARALSVVLNILDPDVVVLGGGVSNLRRLYENVPKIWGRYAFTDEVRTKLVPAQHGDSSGVRGAAWLWPKFSPKL